MSPNEPSKLPFHRHSPRKTTNFFTHHENYRETSSLKTIIPFYGKSFYFYTFAISHTSRAYDSINFNVINLNTQKIIKLDSRYSWVPIQTFSSLSNLNLFFAMSIWIFRLWPPSENCFQRFENKVIKQTRAKRCFCLHVALYSALMNKILNIGWGISLEQHAAENFLIKH